MNTIGKLFSRIATTMTMVLLALVIALPLNASVLAAAAFVPDDFNRCSLNTGLWEFQNPASLPNTRITGQFTGESTLDITIPQNTVATFSNTNKNAPRIMQPAADADFEVEVKFNSALTQMTGNNWNIQGILVRDAAANRWLRFDLNSDFDSINYYIGYIDENGALHDIFGPATISQTHVNEAPLYLRVKYEQALNRWSLGYQISDKVNFAYRRTFLETDAISGLPSGFSFNVSHVGVFAGSTGSSTPGFVSKVDYFKSVPDAFTDDAFLINVTKAGTGTGNVNWPMTSASQCSGNQVTLTATPTNGAVFGGWSGDAVSGSPTITLTMTQSYNLTATFNGGEPVEQPYDLYLPHILR